MINLFFTLTAIWVVFAVVVVFVVKKYK